MENKEIRFYSLSKSSKDKSEGLTMIPSTTKPTSLDSSDNLSEKTKIVNPESLRIPGDRDDKSPKTPEKTRLPSGSSVTVKESSYARALTNQKESNNLFLCECDPPKSPKAIKISMNMANTYRKATEILLPHGSVEAISLDPVSQLHTAVLDCECQAARATTSLKLATGPFTPPPDFTSEYNPRTFFKDLVRKRPTESITPASLPPSFPKIFRIVPKGNPSTFEILAHLSREIGHLQPNCITRVQNHFTLRIEKDSQSLMITKMDLSDSNIIQQIYPHPELNTSKSVCYNRELFHTPKEIIKSYTSPQVQEVHQLKGTNSITILTFPTPQPPKKIEILGQTLKLETYREKPKQCKKCFSYMHKAADCRKEPRCNRCSSSNCDYKNETCERNPHCCLCRGDHSPISRTCPIYIDEEDLLNEALRRGCGRGHIRAERRAAELQESRNIPGPSQPSNSERKEEGNKEIQTWTEKKTGRKGRRQTTSQSKTPIPDSPSFELPHVYRKEFQSETSDHSPNYEDNTRPKARQMMDTQKKSNINPFIHLQETSIAEEEIMNVSLEEDITPKPKSPKTNQHYSDLDPTKESPSKKERAKQSPTKEKEIVKNTGSMTVPPHLQSPTIGNLMGISTSEDTSQKEAQKSSATAHQQTACEEPTKNITPKRYPSEESTQEQSKPLSESPTSTSPQEPPKKRGKQSSPNSQNPKNSVKTTTPPATKSSSKKIRRCNICKTSYKTLACFKEHQAYFHQNPNDKPKPEKIPNYDATRVPREHKCSEVPHEPCLILYKILKGFPSEENSHLVDTKENIYESISQFRRGIKRSSTTFKQSNRDKIYGPKVVGNPLKPEDSETPKKEKENITDKTKTLPKDKPQTSTQNPKYSREVTEQRIEKTPSNRNIVRNVVAQLEVAEKRHLQQHPLQSTWPYKTGQTKCLTQYPLSSRDPRLHRQEVESTRTRDLVKQTQQSSTEQQPKVEQDTQRIHRTQSLRSLDDPLVHQIRTLISARKEKSPSHTSLHKLE